PTPTPGLPGPRPFRLRCPDSLAPGPGLRPRPFGLRSLRPWSPPDRGGAVWSRAPSASRSAALWAARESGSRPAGRTGRPSASPRRCAAWTAACRSPPGRALRGVWFGQVSARGRSPVPPLRPGSRAARAPFLAVSPSLSAALPAARGSAAPTVAWTRGAADETEFRNFIVWLEDQKIRHYKIEDRGNLRNIHSSDWPKFFEKYLRDVNCPFKIQDRQEAIDWLLGLAVRLEYGDNAEKYKDLVPDNTKNADNAAKNAEPLINLDVNNPDFKAGVMALANLLQIQRHDDYLVMLKAIRILVQERLTQDAVAKANQTKEGLPVALDKHILGFDTGDAVLNEAAQILRLLHIEELRELQTKINEAIVAVQAIIADPKTDHRLGKVGR
uniref:RNA transcription, translation and transport factor protein n=1 Tax=Equus asinus TaxID=9793 RepID=A0A9L0IU73_EQUAS